MSRAPVTVSLVPLSAEHLERSFCWLQSPDLQEAFLLRAPASLDAQRAWFERRVLGGADEDEHLAVVGDGTHVGNCGLKNVNTSHGTAELFIFLGPESAGAGYGSAAVEALKDRARQRRLHKLYLYVRTDNLAAIRLYMKADFAVEGHLRSEFRWAGKPVDAYRMGWLAT